MNVRSAVRLVAPVMMSAVLLCATAPAQASARHPVARACSGRSCVFYFGQATTISIKNRLDKSGWLPDAAGSVICARVPNWAVAGACGAVLTYGVAKAKKQVDMAYEEGGCFAVRAKLGLNIPIKFDHVSPDHSGCH